MSEEVSEDEHGRKSVEHQPVIVGEEFWHEGPSRFCVTWQTFHRLVELVTQQYLAELEANQHLPF